MVEVAGSYSHSSVGGGGGGGGGGGEGGATAVMPHVHASTTVATGTLKMFAIKWLLIISTHSLTW